MSNLQNKAHFQQNNHSKPRKQIAYTRSRYKREAQLLENQAQVFYSDQESCKKQIVPASNKSTKTSQIRLRNFKQLKQLKSKKTRLNQKKGCKSKAVKLQNQETLGEQDNRIPDFPSNLSSSILSFGHQFSKKNSLSFETQEQIYLKKLNEIKQRVDIKFKQLKGAYDDNSVSEICFRHFNQYRPYFEKETEISYEQYLKKCQSFKKQAIFSKVNQLIRLEIQSKHCLLKKLSEQKFTIQKASKIIQSIADQSQKPGLPDQKIVNAACNIQLNQSFGAINQFLQQNSPLIQIREQQFSIRPKCIESNKNQSPYNSVNQSQSNKILSREKRRRETLKRIQSGLQSPKQKIERLASRNIQNDSNRINDRKKILASIQMVNKQCQQKQRLERMQSQRHQREREKQKIKSVKKDPSISQTNSNHEHPKINTQNESEKQRQQNMREAQWYTYHKSNPKIKRLQILNRYHYNPFQQNQGQDQCELWKKLMSGEIKSIKNEGQSNRHEDLNQNLIDQLLREVDQYEREQEKLSRLPPNDIFILPTDYKPHNNWQKTQYQSENTSQQKTKSNKKSKKSRSKKKRSKKSKQKIPDIQDFLNLGESSKQKLQEDSQEQSDYDDGDDNPDADGDDAESDDEVEVEEQLPQKKELKLQQKSEANDEESKEIKDDKENKEIKKMKENKQNEEKKENLQQHQIVQKLQPVFQNVLLLNNIKKEEQISVTQNQPFTFDQLQDLQGEQLLIQQPKKGSQAAAQQDSAVKKELLDFDYFQSLAYKNNHNWKR